MDRWEKIGLKPLSCPWEVRVAAEVKPKLNESCLPKCAEKYINIMWRFIITNANTNRILFIYLNTQFWQLDPCLLNIWKKNAPASTAKIFHFQFSVEDYMDHPISHCRGKMLQ